MHPDDERWHADALQASVDTCGEYDVEYRIVLPGGETRWIHARGRHLPGPDGRTDHLIGAAYDTTGEREASTRVTRVLEAMPAGFYSLDREWRFTHVNAEAERLLGHSRDELLGEVLWEAFPATVGQRLRGELPQGGRAAGSRSSFDAYYPAPLDGWYELRAWPTPDGLSVYFLEVTDRRAAQERAERSARQLAILAQVSAELAGTLDTAGGHRAAAAARRPGAGRLLRGDRHRRRRRPAGRRQLARRSRARGRCWSATARSGSTRCR